MAAGRSPLSTGGCPRWVAESVGTCSNHSEVTQCLLNVLQRPAGCISLLSSEELAGVEQKQSGQARQEQLLSQVWITGTN